MNHRITAAVFALAAVAPVASMALPPPGYKSPVKVRAATPKPTHTPCHPGCPQPKPTNNHKK